MRCLPIILLLLLVACHPVKEIVEVPIVKVLHDTLTVNKVERDSLYIRDSIYAEGAIVYKERLIYKTKHRIDTMYKVRCDTVSIPKIITKEIVKPEKWYDRFLKILGFFSAALIIVLILVRR